MSPASSPATGTTATRRTRSTSATWASLPRPTSSTSRLRTTRATRRSPTSSTACSSSSDKKAAYNIKVANLSLTSTVAQSYTIDPLAAAAEQAHFAGILVVAASGNSGPNSVNFAPGNDPYVLSVGGADDRGTKDTKDDVIASWTSTGLTRTAFASRR